MKYQGEVGEVTVEIGGVSGVWSDFGEAGTGGILASGTTAV